MAKVFADDVVLSDVSVEENCGSNTIQPETKLIICPSITKGSVNITYQVTNPQSSPDMKIYNASGRLIRSFVLSTPYCLLPTSMSWDAKDNAGNDLPNGIYFVQLETETYRVTNKVIIAK